MLLCILAISGGNILTRFLSCSFLFSLGVVNCSFYLFHSLVIKFVKPSGGRLVANGAVRVILI